jgi:hypothetical protein
MAQAILQGVCGTSWGVAGPAPPLAAAIGAPWPGSKTRSLAGACPAARPAASGGYRAGLAGALAPLSRRDRCAGRVLR